MLEINKDPSRKELRWFGLMVGLALGVLGLVLWLKTALLFGLSSRPTVASLVVWGMALVFPVVYYAVPALQKRLYVGFLYAVFPIGFVVSNVILALAYYLVVTPIGLVMRLFGYDPMERRLRPEEKSYWVEHQRVDDPKRYFRQF